MTLLLVYGNILDESVAEQDHLEKFASRKSGTISNTSTCGEIVEGLAPDSVFTRNTHRLKRDTYTYTYTFTNSKRTYRKITSSKTYRTVTRILFPESCIVGKIYCGSELIAKNWGRSFTSNGLYKCFSGGLSATTLTTCTKCSLSTGDAFCQCTPGSLYCGRDLTEKFYWTNNILPRTIYLCSSGGLRATVSRVCSRGCSCGCFIPRCLVDPCHSHGSQYCGHELIAKGWPKDQYRSNRLFVCSTDGLSATTGKLG